MLIVADQRLLLERRPAQGLWGGLLVPPEGEAQTVLAARGLAALETRELPPLEHAFTHFRLTLRPVLCRVAAVPALSEAGACWLPLSEAAAAGVPTPIGKLIRQVASAAD